MGKSNRKPCLDNVFYVYAHIRKDSGNIFYIGKGKGDRCKSRSGRSKKWREIVDKFGYEIEILRDNLHENDAFDIERELISHHRDGLCNKSSGGQGPSGMIHSKETRIKLRNAKIGKKQLPDHAKKSAIARLGKKNSPSHVEATVSTKRKKIINSDGEVFISAAEAARVFSKRLSRKCSQGNISMCAAGSRAQAYGKTWSYDTSERPILKEVPSPKKKIIMKKTGMVFDSATSAAKYISKIRGKRTPTQSITQAARKGGNAYGSKWEYLPSRTRRASNIRQRV